MEDTQSQRGRQFTFTVTDQTEDGTLTSQLLSSHGSTTFPSEVDHTLSKLKSPGEYVDVLSNLEPF